MTTPLISTLAGRGLSHAIKLKRWVGQVACEVDGARYSDPRYGLPDHRDEHELRLSKVFPRPGNGLRCAYDLVQPWRYRITCEKIFDPDPGMRYPACSGVPDAERDRQLARLRLPQPWA
ncbi:plasmid pRiA4b ORF-3 family protein [Amycolatopsis pithecellobii]|uniref:plasmid pRiA4b ORF-3 family protein n=1 Tax=Amycolatopsis pithecellobii TaxID=664692 RepID=UPI00140E82CF|nr:plasmid pRiA4b ORF-3 family protein [Amycolatopsis pithecellobii]